MKTIWVGKGTSRSLRGNVDRNDADLKKSIEEELVVPYVGTWIEISVHELKVMFAYVVPYVGTWIEMFRALVIGQREDTVVPYVGTWIEIDN